jgi:putative FmdB family regulatory protein
MPLYEYQCDACAQRFEVIRKFSDSPVEVCRVCGSGPVRKLLSSPAIQFKGSGWYITDYARKSGDSSASTSESDSSKPADSASKETASSDTAPAKPASDKSTAGKPDSPASKDPK